MRKLLTIRRYKRLSPRLFELLYNNFTFVDGGLRSAMNGNRIIHIFVAFFNQEVIGWSAVYRGYYDRAENIEYREAETYSIGVYVKEKYRHRGVGGKLKRKTLLWTMRNNLYTYWYDAKNEWTAYIVTTETLGASNEQL
jgi:GNAT superfamily N-acetyltransferase